MVSRGGLETRCKAREGLGIATAVMRKGADMARFLSDVKSDIDAISAFRILVQHPD